MVDEKGKRRSGRTLRTNTRNADTQVEATGTTSNAPRRSTRNAAVRDAYGETAGKEESSGPQALKTRAKKTVPSYLQRSEGEDAVDPNLRAWPFGLPPELFREITSYLPPEATVCFTLTCKLALHLLGTSSWTDENTHRRWHTDPETGLEHRYILLNLLVRDVRDGGLEFCRRCQTLHPPLKRPSEHRQTKLTKYCWGQDAVVDYLPRGPDGRGYSLVFDHVKHVLQTSPPDSGLPIDYLAGSFEVPHPRFRCMVTSSARYVNRNLIIRHDYDFSPASSKTPLKAADVLGLPLQICPHHSTTTETPPRSRYLPGQTANGPLLTHSIASVFPAPHRTGIPKPSAFRKPTSLEQKAMTAADGGEDVTFRCRSCPTKWRVGYTAPGGGSSGGSRELKVTAFHCFYSQYTATGVWSCFARREGHLLGKSKRNSEFWSQGRTFVEFAVE